MAKKILVIDDSALMRRVISDWENSVLIYIFRQNRNESGFWEHPGVEKA